MGAADFNGDGFDDLIVGAPQANTEFGHDSGSTYVVLGINRLFPNLASS